jgi:hypothetical protein
VNSNTKLKTKTTSALGTFSPRVAGNHNAHWQWKQRPHRLWQAGAMPWTPYADWIFTAVSTTSLLLVVWLVVRPRP